MTEVLIVSRLLQFAAVIVVFGCGAFRLYGLAFDTTTTSANALVTFDAWFWRVTIVGVIVGSDDARVVNREEWGETSWAR